MSWATLLRIVADVGGVDVAKEVERRARTELGGVRITVGKRQAITADIVDALAPGNPKAAAKQLGVHPSTIYRAMNRRLMTR